MGYENRNCIHLVRSRIDGGILCVVIIKHLHLNKGARIFACLVAVGCLRRADLMVYVNTWKFMWLGVPYGIWGRLRQ